MKKLFSVLAIFGLLSFGATGSASAACYEWQKVCKPIYKVKVFWGTCYNKYDHPYKCKKKKRVHVGKKCHNKCVSWKPHKKVYKYKKYKKHHNAY